ncbi:hypothetical protein JTB14_035645 [Gonioctena quinquepunctata]|nr:hypothetical protein JTB14_035645 [Gonioctena quinquepunctata]
MDNPSAALKILRNKNKLPLDQVKVGPDLTIKQREHLNELRRDLLQRTEKGEQDLTIKGSLLKLSSVKLICDKKKTQEIWLPKKLILLKMGVQNSKMTQKKLIEMKFTKEQINQYKAVFDKFDEDKSGEISVAELGIAMERLGENVTQKEIQNMIKAADLDNNGAVDFEEFLLMILRRQNSGVALPEDDEIFRIFKIFDTDGSGKITRTKLKRGMAALGEDLTEEEVNFMVKEADVDGDGVINYQDFKTVFKNLMNKTKK